MAIEAALREVSVDFDLEVVAKSADAEARARFARINPRQQVPVLVHPDGTVITEGPAILYHIADAFPAAGLIPAPGTPARARHDRWMSFLHANVYEAMLRELFPGRYTTDSIDTAGPGIQSAATDYVRRHFLIFEAEIGDGPYVFRNEFSVLDIYVWMLCYWIDAGWLASNCPRINRLWATASARPILKQIATDHFG